MRLVLRLFEPDRFELTASDALGRPLWSLAIEEDGGRFLEGGARTGCRLATGRALRLPRMDWELPVADLPAVLVGRLPEPPSPDDSGGASIDFRDGAERHWTAVRDQIGPLRWTLWQDGEASLRWERTDRGGLLTDPSGGVQIRWRESAREPLAESGLALASVSADEPDCPNADLS